MAGEHTAYHIGVLLAMLPRESCVHKAVIGKDAEWTLESTLLADIRNNLVMLMYAMSDPKKRGQKPKRIGPSWMTRAARTLEARVLSITELMQELSKPRR